MGKDLTRVVDGENITGPGDATMTKPNQCVTHSRGAVLYR